MREGANRAIAYALLASFLLHALALALLPSLRQVAAPLPPEPEPLIARVEQLAPPPPAPRAPEPVRNTRKPPAPRTKPVPKPAEPLAKAPPAPAPEPIAAPPPAPAPAPEVPAVAPSPPPPARAEPSALAPLLQPAPAPVGPEVALQRYRRDVTEAAARFKRYPRVAIDNGWEGEVTVRLAIGADGRIASLDVTSGSGFPVLDRQALDMFRNAKPFVPIPSGLRGHAFELDLRAVFDLRDAR